MTSTSVLTNVLNSNALEEPLLAEPFMNFPNCVVLTASVQLGTKGGGNEFLDCGLAGDVNFITVENFANGKYIFKIINWDKNYYNFNQNSNPLVSQTSPDNTFDYSKILFVHVTIEDLLFPVPPIDWTAVIPPISEIDNNYHTVYWWKPELGGPAPNAALEKGITVSFYKYADNTAVNLENKRLNIEIVFQDLENGVKFK